MIKRYENKSNRMKWPSIKAVASRLRGAKYYCDKQYNDGGVDVRLQVLEDGRWTVHVGDSQYDQDHRGYWGSGYVEKRTNCHDLAIDLLDQCRDHHAQCE